jgi:magnesium transporter
MSPTDEQAKHSRITHVQHLLDSGTMHQVADLLHSLKPGEIAHLLEGLPHTEREIIWSLVGEHDGEILVHLSDTVREDLISRMDSEDLASAVENLDLDDLADLIQDLPREVTVELLESLDSQRRHRLESVLHYEEDSAGGLMNIDVISVRPEVSLDTVLRYMRLLGERVPANTDALIVVNRDDNYLGMLPLTALVTSNPALTVAEAMHLDFLPIPAKTPAKLVAERFEHHDLVSAPVTDDNGLLLGRITIDDVVDFIREEGEHQFMGQAGLSEAEDMFAPVFSSVKRRALWLGLNLITVFMASLVIDLFQETIEQLVALAILMPIVANMGGIAGTQTMTLAIRGIALGQLSGKNMPWLVLKEFSIGLFNSLIWASIVAVVVYFWFGDLGLSLLIMAAMSITLVFAALNGALIPITLHRLKIDPAIAGGMFLTTVTDIVAFFVFLGMATMLLI